ncbi:ribosome-recycling factor [Candidatus Parcubacteria bacterium]|nr:ribosome-recycling factor [Candidatus Parcubacteria bacterium]
MAYDFSPFKKASEDSIEWLKREYTGLNTGRAMPAILDTVMVNAYGSKMAIAQLATISVEDSKTLRVVPWDKAVGKDIDSAVRESNLGLSVTLDATGLRLSFPSLTSERREILKKLAKEKLEEARIKIRNERQKVLTAIERQDGGEDEEKRLKNELQKFVDEANKKLEDLAEKKNSEITTG